MCHVMPATPPPHPQAPHPPFPITPPPQHPPPTFQLKGGEEGEGGKEREEGGRGETTLTGITAPQSGPFTPCEPETIRV